MVRDRFGWDDVFSMAEQLYTEVQLSAAPATDLRPARRGNITDLGRGLVFAAPTLMFAGATIALRSSLSWWMLPLSLTCGWAFSQVVAYVGFSRNDRGDSNASPVLWALLAATAVCICLGLVGDALLGGKFYGVLFAASGCTFMAASAELVVHHEELLIAFTLLPGATGSIIYITHFPVSLPRTLVLVLAATSVIGAMVLAMRHLPSRWWAVPALNIKDAPMAARYFTLGIFSGLLVAIFIVLEPARSGTRTWPAVAAYPMVLSLGAMEWQLHSLRAGGRNALLESSSIKEFTRAARWQLVRATLSYFLVLAVLTVLVSALAYTRELHPPATLIIAGTALAVAFFLALVVAACGRIDLVLRAWLPGLAIYAGLGHCGPARPIELVPSRSRGWHFAWPHWSRWSSWQARPPESS